MKNYIIIIWIALLGFPSMIMGQDKVWTLEDCINYALEQNITVRKTNLNNQSLEFQAEQARAQRMPNLNASFSQNFNWNKPLAGTGLSGNTSSSYSVNSGVTVFNGSRITNQIKQSQLDIENGKYTLETTKESISLNILNAFLQVLYAEEQVKNSEKQIESTTSQVNLAQERLRVKIISQADYAQVKSQLASEKLNLANAISQLAIAKVNLMQLMELPVTENFEVAQPDLAASLDQQRAPIVQSVYDTALAIKPQIKSAAINKELALLDEKIAKAGYMPSLSASAGFGSNAAYSLANDGNTSDAYFSQLKDDFSPSAGLTLAIPIYQKKQVKTSVALAKIGYQTAELNEIDTRNQLRKNIEQACQDVLSAQTQYQANVENYNATSESSLLSDEKFKQGLINSVDYLVSKTNLIVAESQLLQSKYNLIFSYKILDFYLGIPLTL
ncbi:MAG TPA: TolC family protein [Bacteroidales bacterium]|nr:TolC family protein [Bacteroidales bacterium]